MIDVSATKEPQEQQHCSAVERNVDDGNDNHSNGGAALNSLQRHAPSNGLALETSIAQQDDSFIFQLRSWWLEVCQPCPWEVTTMDLRGSHKSELPCACSCSCHHKVTSPCPSSLIASRKPASSIPSAHSSSSGLRTHCARDLFSWSHLISGITHRSLL